MHIANASEVNQILDLDGLLVCIKLEFEDVEKAEGTALDHAIAAAHHLNRARDLLPPKHPGGFRGWMEAHGLKKTQCYSYMKLAANEASVRTSGHTSIIAALKALSRAKPRKPKSESPRALTKAAWVNATSDERREFLDAIGVDEILEAMSGEFGHKLRARVPVPTITAQKKKRKAAMADKRLPPSLTLVVDNQLAAPTDPTQTVN
jgi:hypothetical protein